MTLRPHSILPLLPSALALVLIGTLAATPASATDAASESGQLALLLRQLDAMERRAAQAQQTSGEHTSRYHFDHAALKADLRRVREGVRNYLAPPRAQPRDVTPLLGDYRTTGRTTTESP
jgi:RAQPRD family integrative conjugative element protein